MMMEVGSGNLFVLWLFLLLLPPAAAVARKNVGYGTDETTPATTPAFAAPNSILKPEFTWNEKDPSPNSDDNDDESDHLFSGALKNWMLEALGDKGGRVIQEQLIDSIANSETNKIISLRRSLSSGRWESFNRLFQNARLQIPPITIEEDLGLRLELDINGVSCFDISIQDLELVVTTVSNREIKVTVNLKDLDIGCVAPYNYAYGSKLTEWLRGSGEADLIFENNYAVADLTFKTGSSFQLEPPTSVSVKVQVAKFFVYDIDFRGGIVAKILDTIEKLFREFVEHQLQEATKNELKTLGTEFIKDAVAETKLLIDPYLKPIPPSLSDPLFDESYFLSSAANLDDYICFTDLTEGSLAALIADLLGQADKMFGKTIEDLGSPTGTGYDLAVNTFLRKNLLNSDRVLAMRIEDLPFEPFDTTLFESHDVISKSKVILTGFSIYGLDTFKTFDPLVDIGCFTLQNAFHLDELKVTIDLLVNIRPSDLPDALLQGADMSVSIDEHIQVSFGVDELNVILSIFLVLNEAQLLEMQLGSLLRQDNIVACAASLVQKLKISGLGVSVGNIHEPTLEGFISEGIDDLVTNAVDAIFRMYEPTFLRALAHIFQSFIRPILEEEILAAVDDFSSKSMCEWEIPSGVEGPFLDFREFFLQEDESLPLGGSGAQPYGDIGPVAYDLLQQNLHGFDDSGDLNLNGIIDLATKAQSGIPGMIVLPDTDFVSVAAADRVLEDSPVLWKHLVESVDLSVSDVVARNLNTARKPLVIVQPTTKASTLENELNFGGQDQRNLEASARLNLVVEGPSPLAFNDEIEFSLSLESLHLVADVVARIATLSFMSLPLENILDLNCWLALIPEPEQGQTSRNLGLEAVTLEMKNILLSSYVISGSSAGIQVLPTALEIVENSGFIDLFASRLQEVIKELLTSNMTADMLENKIRDSSSKCSSSPSFDPDFDGGSLPDVEDLSLSAETVDTLMFGALGIGQILLIVLFENHLHFQGGMPGVPHIFYSTNMLDWTNIGGSLGIGSVADEAFKALRDFVTGVDGEGVHNLNALLDEVSNNSGAEFSFDLSDTAVDIGGLNVHLSTITIGGLNSFKSVDLLNPIQPSKLTNFVALEELHTKLQIVVTGMTDENGNGTEQELLLSFSMEDIEVHLDLLAGFDIDRLLSLHLGSILHLEDIVPCILSATAQVGIEEFLVTLGQMSRPAIHGLLEETQASMNNTQSALYDRFLEDVVDAVPAVTNTTVRQLVNNIVEILVHDQQACPDRSSDFGQNDVVDFRELFLGTGSETYGALGVELYSIAQQILTSTDNEGNLKFNKLVLDPVTEEQSGSAGSLSFPSAELVSFETQAFEPESSNIFADLLTGHVKLHAGNLLFENLNTLAPPLELIRATDLPHMLANRVGFGLEEAPDFSVKARLGIMVESASSSPLAIDGVVEVQISLAFIELILDVAAHLNASALVSFPIQHILNLDCWLSLFVDTHQPGQSLRFDRVVLELRDMVVQAAVLAGSSPGIQTIPTAIDILQGTGAIHVLAGRFSSFFDELLESEMVAGYLQNMINDGHSRCPIEHTSYHIGNPSDIPTFSLARKELDTVLYSAILLAHVPLFILLENHRSFNSSLPGNEKLQDISETPSLLDWTNLSSLGLGMIVEEAFEFGRDFIGGRNDEGDLTMNTLLRNLLDGNGLLVFELEDEIHLGGLSLGVTNLSIGGLDTFTAIDLLSPIGPQELSNKLSLDHLNLAVNLRLSSATESQHVRLSLDIRDVELSVDILAAFDTERLLNMSIGSILHTGDILPCLFSSAHSLALKKFNITVGDFGVPTVVGLMPDTGQSMNATLTALYNHFDIEGSIPKVFNTTVKQLLNTYLLNMISKQSCPDRTSGLDNEMIAVADIFDGNGAYGDLLDMVWGFVDNEFLLGADNSGMSALNRILRQLTERQSGIAGEIRVPQNLFDIALGRLHKIGVKMLEVAMGNISLSNLDSVEAPVLVLQPNEDDATILENHISIGADPSPLQFVLDTILSLSGDKALSSYNQLEIGLELEAAEIFAAVKAKVNNMRLMSFPLREITDFNCWLALFGPPRLDDSGFPLPGEEAGLAIEQIKIIVEDIRLHSACGRNATCTSSGISSLEDVLAVFDYHGVTDLLTESLLDFVSDLTSVFQTYLERLLADSYQQCNTASKDGLDSVLKSFPIPSSPSVTPKILDTLVYAASYLFEVALIVVFKSHESYRNVDNNPLVAQEELTESSKDVELIDFSNLSVSVGGWAESLFDRLRSFASDSVSNGDGGRDFGVNVLLQKALLDETGRMVFDLSHVSLDEKALQITLGNLTLSGLDSITNISLMEAIGPQTLRTELIMKHVVVGLEVHVNTSGAAMDGYIELAIDDFHLTAAILLGVVKSELGDLELGQMLDSDWVFRCLLSTVHTVSFPLLHATFGNVTSFKIEGFHDPDVQAAVDYITVVSLREFRETILTNTGPFFDFSVKAILNSYVDYMLSRESTTSCPKPSRTLASRDGKIVDLRDLLLPPAASIDFGGSGQEQYGDMFFTLFELMKEEVLKIKPSTGLSAVNSILISELTEAQSGHPGRLFFPGDLVDGGIELKIGGLDLTIDFRLYDAFIANLDTVGAPFSLLDPVLNEPANLNNTATVGLVNPLQIGARVYLSITDPKKDIINDVEVVLNIETLLIVLEALLRLSEGRFFTFPVRDLLSVDCLLSLMPAPLLDRNGVRLPEELPSAGLEHLALSLSSLKLNVSCVGVCSPGMFELMDLLSTEEASQASTSVANKVLDYATGMLGGTYLEVTLDRLLNEAHRNCPSSPLYEEGATPRTYDAFSLTEEEEDVRFLVMLGIAAGCMIVALLAVMLMVKTFVLCRHRRWLRSLPRRDLEFVLYRQTKTEGKETQMNATTRSMFRSSDIPLYVRLLMPLIILGNVGFFLSGHLSLGGTVNIILQLGGEEIRIENFFEFSIMKSTIEIWNAGGTELAIMILIFSVIWPYTKQFITLFLWFAGPRLVSISRRGSLFLWLDTLAKWSMVDIMTLVVTVAAFRVSIQSPDVAFLPEGFYSLDLVVVPLWGLYSNMIAQLISQISSHFIIYYHRRIEQRASTRHDQAQTIAKSALNLPLELDGTDSDSSSQTLSDDLMNAEFGSDESSDRLYKHAFQRPHRTDSDKLLVRSTLNPMVVVGLLAVFSLILVGCILPSFSIEILGLVAIFVESGQGFSEAKTDHSIFSIVTLLREQADVTGRLADRIGLGSLSALLLFSVLLVPIAQAGVLVYVWFSKMGAKRRKKWAVVVETLQAWQYVEVYLVSIIVASWQLGPVSDFMINSYCKSLDELFGQLVYHGILKSEDAQCFRVEAQIESASYALAAGAVVLALLNTFVMKAVAQYFRDSEERSNATFAVAHPVDDDADEPSDSSSTRDISRNIKPVPVLFTDTFRWCLIREDAVVVQAHLLDGEQDKYNNFSQHTPAAAVAYPVACSEEQVHLLPRALPYEEDEHEVLVDEESSNSREHSRSQNHEYASLRTDDESLDLTRTETVADYEVDVDTTLTNSTESTNRRTRDPPATTDIAEYEYMMDTLYELRSSESCGWSDTSVGDLSTLKSSKSTRSRSTRMSGRSDDQEGAEKPSTNRRPISGSSRRTPIDP